MANFSVFALFLTEHEGWGILRSCCVSHEQEHSIVIAMAKLVSQGIDKMHLAEFCSAPVELRKNKLLCELQILSRAF